MEITRSIGFTTLSRNTCNASVCSGTARTHHCCSPLVALGGQRLRVQVRRRMVLVSRAPGRPGPRLKLLPRPLAGAAGNEHEAERVALAVILPTALVEAVLALLFDGVLPKHPLEEEGGVASQSRLAGPKR